MSTIELDRWLANPKPETFPLKTVVAAFRKVGKHFVSRQLLEGLARVRGEALSGDEPLRRFLDTALDKFDGRYDNPSYLALHELPLPSTEGRCPLDTAEAERQRDRLVTMLVADLLRFEIDAFDGKTELLPEMRPDARITAKRCALGLRVLRPAMLRQGHDLDTLETDPIEIARQMIERVEASETDADRRTLAVTLLTVSTIHDENLFVRVLQCYETTFALIVAELRAAIVAVDAGNAARARQALDAAEAAMREIAPLFSLVATMQPEAFRSFREFTDGASAVQSRNYKMMESLCRRPSPDRLAGPGYDAVPEVRARVMAGQRTLEQALSNTRLWGPEIANLRASMMAFEDAVMDWRKMHHNLALRMLGARRGTGYTEGVSYLASARQVPLFSRCPFGDGARSEAA